MVFEVILATIVAISPFFVTNAFAQDESEPKPVPAAKIDFQVSVEDGQNAHVSYNGTTSYAKIGQLVRFDLSNSLADSYKWLIITKTPDFETYDNGSKAVVSFREPGEYRFVVAVAKGGTVDVFTHLVIVRAPPSEPVNGTLADYIPYWLYDSGLPTVEAQMLAASFERTANAITADMSPEQIIKYMADSNRAAMGAALTDWVPLLQKITVVCDRLTTNGDLMTVPQYKSVFLDIAKGLRRYAP